MHAARRKSAGIGGYSRQGENMRKLAVAALAAVSVVGAGRWGHRLRSPAALAQHSRRDRPRRAAARAGASAQVAAGATEVIAEMRDGVRLAGNLYLPQGKGPFPCIVQRTPYGKDAMFASPAGAKKYTDGGLCLSGAGRARERAVGRLLPGLHQRCLRWL